MGRKLSRVIVGEFVAFVCGISFAATIAILCWPESQSVPDAPNVVTVNRLRSLAAQFGEYRRIVGAYPDPSNWAVTIQSYWGGPQASPNQARLFFDGWERPVEFRLNLGHYELSSGGESASSEDDITIQLQ